jgi:hypothetical protein
MPPTWSTIPTAPSWRWWRCLGRTAPRRPGARRWSWPEEFGLALNRDVLVPRPAGRFLFARLINRDAEKLQLLPLEAGGRQQVIPNPPWLGMAVKLVRSL